jgi:uncharacterized RDD family membrane protein YckC
MNCSLCGDLCRCSLEPEASAISRGAPDVDNVAISVRVPESEDNAALSGSLENLLGTSASPAPDPAPVDEPSAWRDELSARLNEYRSRRKPAPPRYPSLRLPFDEPQRTPLETSYAPPRPQPFDTVSNRAVAFDLSALASAEAEVAAPRPLSNPDLSPPPPPSHASAKIIEFPRPADMPPRAPSDELADPVFDRPRILEVPEVTPPPPAMGGINMEAVAIPEVEKRLGIDVPLQSASVVRRLIAGAIDGAIVAAASSLFGYIFWKITAYRPPMFQLVGLAAGVPSLLWAGYQYLLIVYSGSTPGIRISGLRLERFDGTQTTRRLRRWRVLGSYLSAVSLGLGYAWVLLDEDSLCWHDRITHSYLAPKNH